MNRVHVQENGPVKMKDGSQESDKEDVIRFVYDDEDGENNENDEDELSAEFRELIQRFQKFTASEGEFKSYVNSNGEIRIRAFDFIISKTVDDTELSLKTSVDNYIWPARLVVKEDKRVCRLSGGKNKRKFKNIQVTSCHLQSGNHCNNKEKGTQSKTIDDPQSTPSSEIIPLERHSMTVTPENVIAQGKRNANDGHLLHSSLGIYNIKSNQQSYETSTFILKSTSATDYGGKLDQEVSRVSKILNTNNNNDGDQEAYQHLSIDEEMPFVVTHNRLTCKAAFTSEKGTDTCRKRGYYALEKGEDREVTAIMRKRLRSRSPFLFDQETMIREWKFGFKPIFVEFK